MNIRLNGEKTMRKDMGETEFYSLHYRKMDVKIPKNSLLICIKSLSQISIKLISIKHVLKLVKLYLFFPIYLKCFVPCKYIYETFV